MSNTIFEKLSLAQASRYCFVVVPVVPTVLMLWPKLFRSKKYAVNLTLFRIKHRFIQIAVPFALISRATLYNYLFITSGIKLNFVKRL